jgi:hypothetical protein
MNQHFEITRFPNAANMLRGPNMKGQVCQKCLKEKTHGFKLVEFIHALNDKHLSIFVCDDCLKQAKKEKKAK